MKKNNFIVQLSLLLAVPALLYAEGLRSLLDYASSNNQLIIANTLSQKAKAKELDAQTSNYYPTLDLGLFYQRSDERTITLPGDVYSGYAKLGFDIYDGGRKSSLVAQKQQELESSRYDTQAIKKSLNLQIVQDFYNIKSLEANLMAFEEAKISLLTQLNRMKKFYEAKVATQDDVDRLQSAYDTNIYEIESVKFQILSVKNFLSLKIAKDIDVLDSSSFKEVIIDDYEFVDTTKSLIAKKESIVSGAQAVDSVYYPNIRIEDTYSLYEYGRTDTLHPAGLDNQNKLLVSLNLRVFDNSSTKETKQALLINSQALSQQIQYQQNEQIVHYKLALQRIKTSKIKIKSALSALNSATSAFKTVEEKYNAGLVDNIVYLDSLTAQTRAKALYKTSINDLEVAYAMYYYYSGKKLEEFLND